MLDIIEDKRSEIEGICKRFHVSRLEIFGSALTENFLLESSDIDLLVEFKPLKAGEHADTYFGLLDAMNNLFGRHIDLVMKTAIKNPYFLQKIDQHKETLYAA